MFRVRSGRCVWRCGGKSEKSVAEGGDIAHYGVLRGRSAVSSGVEHHLDTVGVTGSNPVSRIYFQGLAIKTHVLRNASGRCPSVEWRLTLTGSEGLFLCDGGTAWWSSCCGLGGFVLSVGPPGVDGNGRGAAPAGSVSGRGRTPWAEGIPGGGGMGTGIGDGHGSLAGDVFA